MNSVAVAIGSNLGDRAAHLNFAVSRLSSILQHLRVSPFFDTAPVGVPDAQPNFLNAAVVGETTIADPRALLHQLQAIEQEAGRTRPFPNAARTLDLDLILVGDRIVHGAELTLPHPRFRERRFVLEPLAAIAPDWRDPVTHKTISELLAALQPGL